MARPLDPVDGILAVLDSGRATGTNKFGLLLALIDLAPSVAEDGFVPDADLSRKLLDIHWDHARPFDGSVLRQMTSTNRENLVVIKTVATLQQHLRASGYPTGPFERVELLIEPEVWGVAIDEVTRATRANPLKRLQTLDGQVIPFLYEIERRGLRLLDAARSALVRFGPVLRDLVQFRFVRLVALANHKVDGTIEEQIAEHLFGVDRHMPPPAVRAGLWDIQTGRCLYTGETLESPAATSIDHVVPWARVRVSVLENLVLTTKAVNSAKSNLLLAPELIVRWVDHVSEHRSDLTALAGSHQWPLGLARVGSVASRLYEQAPDGAAMWAGPRQVQFLDDAGRSEVIGALNRLR